MSGRLLVKKIKLKDLKRIDIPLFSFEVQNEHAQNVIFVNDFTP